MKFTALLALTLVGITVSFPVAAPAAEPELEKRG
jgi:hypothetical protein